MSSLSPNQIGALIVVWFPTVPAGLFGAEKKDPAVVKWLDTAIAIALAESNGDPLAKNSGSSASGLWQIMYSLHAGKVSSASATVQTATGESSLTVFDARVNTLVASMIYQGAGNKWTPWEAFNTGAYKKYAGKGNAVYDWLNEPARVKKGKDALIAKEKRATDSASVLMDAAGKVLDVKAAFTPANVMGFVREAGVTVGVFVAGLILLILGVVFILSQSKTAKNVAGLIPAGKVLKAVK